VKVTPDGRKAYVTNASTNTVSVIKTSTNKIVKTVSDPDLHQPSALAITPDGTQVWVVCAVDMRISIIDTATDEVVHTINGISETQLWGIAITPDGTKAMVTVFFPGGRGLYYPIKLIDTTTWEITSCTQDPTGDGFDEVACTFILSSGTAANGGGGGGVVFVDAATGVENVPFPWELSVRGASGVSEDGDFQFISQCELNVLSGSGPYMPTSAWVKTVVIPDVWGEHAITRGKLYAACCGCNSDGSGDSIAVLPLGQLEGSGDVTFTRITVGHGPIGTGLTPDGSRLYVASLYANTVSVIDTATDTVVARIVNDWSAADGYYEWNEVMAGGVRYICLNPNTDKPPATNPTFWSVVS
jgi:YVTN family beta-propeller protein